ncbi:hypothetical protein RMCBS344292_19209 [Rhizopus microsporus]|nr:hypothetical protein RMCBS344292_19209 [Rhizopus microsporus]
MNCIAEHLCHSFIVDHSDKTYVVNNIFAQQELTEIAETNRKPCPEPAKESLNYLNTFSRRNTKDLRRSVFASKPWDTEYDKELHCDHDWARNMVYNYAKLEAWDTRIYKNVNNIHRTIDTAFDSIGKVDVARESCSAASCERKTKGQVINNTQLLVEQGMGRSYDLILRAYVQEHEIVTEYSVGEAGRLFEGSSGTITLVESGLKLPKLLKVMLDSIARNCLQHDSDKTSKIETVGYVFFAKANTYFHKIILINLY